MNAYSYGEQYFKKANPGNNITLFYDENGSIDLPLKESSFSYFTVEPVTGEDMWRLEPEKLNAVHYDYVIAMENLSGTLTPVSKIYFSEELLAEIFPEYILPTDEFPIFEIDGKYIIQFSASILLEEATLTGSPKSPRKPLRTPNRVVRVTNRLGETGVLFTMFISSDGAKLERAYQQITELDARELVLFIETKDKDNIFGTVMRIKTGSGVGESERGIPWSEAAKIPRFFGFEVEEGNLRRLIKRHYKNRLDGKENTLYIILKKQRELIEIPVGFTLSFSINALNTLINEVTQTFRLDEKRWNDTLKDYSPLIPLPVNGKVDLSIARKEFTDATDKLATGLDALNRAMIVAPFLRPQLEPRLKVLNRAFTKELPNLVDKILKEAGENLVNSHHFYNALLVGILNSIIDLITGILQIISLMLQLYEAELGAGKQLTENPSSFLSMWMELMENGLEIFTNLLTKENLAALLLFQQKMMLKTVNAGLQALKDPNGVEIPYSHIGYYSGFFVGFIVEEILIALATGGTGNIAQAVNVAMQGFSQTIRGTGKFVKKGAMELVNTMEDFLEMLNQLRKHSKNLKNLLNDLGKQVDDLLEIIRKGGNEILESIRNVRKGRRHRGGDFTKSFFENAGIRTQNYISEFTIFGQTKDYTCVANSLRMVLDDKTIVRTEDFLATALKTDRDGARILDIPDALHNSYLDDLIIQAEKKISLENLMTRMNEGDKAIVSVYTRELGHHALVIDKIENGKIFVRDPLPKDAGSSYSINIVDFKQLFKQKAVIIKN